MTTQPFESQHWTDPEGRPAGGVAVATGVSIAWQNGPLVLDGERVDPNGAFVETVIAIVVDRIGHYQESPFRCVENAEALGHLEAAHAALNDRTKRRTNGGIEGTHGVDGTEGVH